MHLFLAHHGNAVGPEIDPRRPLSEIGHAQVARLAAEAAKRGARPIVVWHSGKLRAKQTAEAYWKACNALAAFSATKDLQPDDPAGWMRDRLQGETRDVLIAGHFTHLPRLLRLLLGVGPDVPVEFPLNGIVTLASEDEGASWHELWRIAP